MTYTIEGITINAPARRVNVGDREVKLTRYEYELLLVLTTDPERVFTKSELLEEIWGTSLVGRSRTLDSHASRLRRKLNSGGGNYVVNCWGVGYCLITTD